MMSSANSAAIPLQDRFTGCLLGLAVGDGLGALFEGQSAEFLAERFDHITALIDYPDQGLTYTDDTQMTVAVAETLVEHHQIVEETLCRNFVADYVPSRGYGRGARCILEAMEDGEDYVHVAETYFPGGSFGNGAAMRVAPVGLFFHNDLAKVREQACLSALPTHRHPLGIEGAQFLAQAVALCTRGVSLDKDTFLGELFRTCQAPEYQHRLEQARSLTDPNQLGQLGNGIAAQDSVVTAIASFTLSPDSFQQTIVQVIALGGDTDTLAAMAGALSGAYLGLSAIPQNLLAQLEDDRKGKSYIVDLARRLFEAHQNAFAHS